MSFADDPCRFCSADGPHAVTPRNDMHGTDVRCIECGRHLGFGGKPDSEKTAAKRPANQRDLVAKFSRGFCEMCGVGADELPSLEKLEAHHVARYAAGGEPTRENIWIVCTPCHRLIEWRRTYMSHWIQPLADALRADR